MVKTYYTPSNYATYLRLHVSVWQSSYELIREARKKIGAIALYDRKLRTIRHEFYRELIEIHENERRLAIKIHMGDLS